jgi:hypothetical protein
MRKSRLKSPMFMRVFESSNLWKSNNSRNSQHLIVGVGSFANYSFALYLINKYMFTN